MEVAPPVLLWWTNQWKLKNETKTLFLWQSKNTGLGSGILSLRKYIKKNMSCPHIYALVIADTFHLFFLLFCSYVRATARVSKRCRKKNKWIKTSERDHQNAHRKKEKKKWANSRSRKRGNKNELSLAMNEKVHAEAMVSRFLHMNTEKSKQSTCSTPMPSVQLHCFVWSWTSGLALKTSPAARQQWRAENSWVRKPSRIIKGQGFLSAAPEDVLSQTWTTALPL